MDLRVLEYFLAVAREQNITRAAESLYLTQPTLSRQLKNLEEELGCTLLVRGKRRVSLTDDGLLFRQKAEEIVRLARRVEAEMKQKGDMVAGDLYIGMGESSAMRHIIQVAQQVQQEYPGIHFHLTSGDGVDLAARLESGWFDFCILYGDMDQARYAYIPLPFEERWGVLMRRDAALAQKERLETRDLWEQPLIVSRQVIASANFCKWLGKQPEELRIVNTYNLIYNGMLMVEAGMGYALTLQGLVNTEDTALIFRPLEPYLGLQMALVWKKEQTQKAAQIFLAALRSALAELGRPHLPECVPRVRSI